MINQPDIILGNNTTSGSPTSDFIMAVIYVDNTGRVRIDYFDINYTSPGAFTVTYNSTNVVPLPPGFTPLGNTHIDVIADHVVTPLYLGRPVCDRFGIAFDAVDVSGVYNVFADYGTLNTYNLSGAGPLNISTSSTVYTSDNYQPDVAAIQRMGGGGPEDVLLLTFTDQNLPGRHLFFLEWNITAGSFWPTLTPLVMDWDVTNPFYKPRIDGDDNLLTNALPGAAHWKVVVEAQNYTAPGVPGVRAYDMITGYGGWDISSWLSSPFVTFPVITHHVPAVAFGPKATTQFMVTESMEDGAGSAVTIMSPFDQTFPFMVALEPL